MMKGNTLFWAIFCVVLLLTAEMLIASFVTSKKELSSPTNVVTFVLAFYFPQYHPIPENDEFWGKGFTEWTMVHKCLRNQSPYSNVLAPADEIGFYDPRDLHVRRRQGELARKHGIDGFIFYHYWFGSSPVMAEVLEKILNDGEPNVKFCLCWANENWSRRWDGGDKNVILEQTYDSASVRAHYDFLKRFWSHRLHMRHGDQTPFFIYMMTLGNLTEMKTLKNAVFQWKEWWTAETRGSLHIVQLIGSPKQDKVASFADAVGEFEPAHGASRANIYAPNRFQRLHQCQYPGVFSGWDNSPRHVSGGANLIQQSTHKLYSTAAAALRSLHRYKKLSPPSCLPMILVNAWNEWGERNVLEPDIVGGDKKLRVVSRAVTKVRSQTRSESVPDPISVCFVVRTYFGHQDHQFYNLSMLIQSFVSLPVHWEAHILVTDISTTKYSSFLRQNEKLDTRIHFSEIPSEFPLKYDACLSAYHVTDWGIRRCSEQTEWVVVTNGDNAYGRNSLKNIEFASEDVDIVLLPVVSRYFRWNFFKYQATTLPTCGDDFQPFASPLAWYGMLDLGGVALRRSRLVDENVFFAAHYPKKCSSLDWFTVQSLFAKGWRYLALAPPSDDYESYFMHNPNPWSCGKLGGVWQDSGDFSEFKCISESEAATKGGLLQAINVNRNRYSCVNSGSSWKNVPSDIISCSGFVSHIASAILESTRVCGLKFDISFYGEKDAESHWVEKGFCTNLPYRLLRTSTFQERKFLSDRCFLLRAFALNSTVSSPEQCDASGNVKIVQAVTRSIFKNCHFELDQIDYFAKHSDVRVSGMGAARHFWQAGMVEGRSANFARFRKQHYVKPALEQFCSRLPDVLPAHLMNTHFEDFLRVESVCVKDSSLGLYSTNNCGMPVSVVWIPDRNGIACGQIWNSAVSS